MDIWKCYKTPFCRLGYIFLFSGTEAEVTKISVTPFPRYGSILGGTLIQVFGPCFDALVDSSITCHFGEIQTRGLYADEDYLICVSPSLEVVGRVGFKVTVADFLIESEEVTFYSCEFTVYVRSYPGICRRHGISGVYTDTMCNFLHTVV